jgi:hypothetical protein
VLAGDAECGDEKSDEESDFLDPSLLMNFCSRKGSFRLSDFPARRGVPHRVPPHRDTTATVHGYQPVYRLHRARTEDRESLRAVDGPFTPPRA